MKLPNIVLGYNVPEGMAENREYKFVKDWSDDDTEPGDDDDFNPAIHRFISSDSENSSDDL